MNIKIYKQDGLNRLELNYKRFTFNGGEVSIKLDWGTGFWFSIPAPIIIVAHIQNSEDLIALANIKNALDINGQKGYGIKLFLPYLPYARQDRVCDFGESFSLKVFTNIVNSLEFDNVAVLDCHSEVGLALLNNVKHITQLELIQRWVAFNNRVVDNRQNVIPDAAPYFISPDAGANKKISKVAGYFNHKEFVRADKLRDLTNGKILETIVYKDDFQGRDVIILDDICDAGGTFIALAQELKKKNAGKVELFVTHGIFAKGFDCLYNEGIDTIWTTNSFKELTDSRVKIFDINLLLQFL